MNDFNNNENGKANTPLDKGKSTLTDWLNIHKGDLMSINFISTKTIPCPAAKFIYPEQNKILMQVFKNTFLLEVKRKKEAIIIKKIANFWVKDVKECNRINNVLIGKQTERKSYIVKLENSNGKVIEIELDGDSKSDFNKFQSVLNEKTNGFLISCDKNVASEFVAKFIIPKTTCTIDIMSNAGVLSPEMFLYENACVINGEPKYADENGIIKIAEGKLIKLDSKSNFRPKLAKSVNSGIRIAMDFVNNIIESWGNDSFQTLLIVGSMIMSVFYKDFIKTGAPITIVFGESGTGKTTIIKCGLFIFGMPRESMISGGSTVKSAEYLSSLLNGIIVCIDDLKGSIITSGTFTEFMKSLYNGIVRTRMTNYGKEIDSVQMCSPWAASTNELLPRLKEVINRLNIFEMFGKSFQTEKFKYFESNEENVLELSLILPEILKINVSEVKDMFEHNVCVLEEKFADNQKRVINNVAYAYTGLQLLLQIAKVELEDAEEKFIKFAEEELSKYEDVQDVVDKVLAAIPTLYKLGKLDKDVFVRFDSCEKNGKTENIVCFHKTSLIDHINQCYSNDKSKYIDIQMFNSYYKTHSRYRGNKTVRYKKAYSLDKFEVSQNSECFSIDGLEDYSVFNSVEGFVYQGDIEPSEKVDPHNFPF